MGPLFEAVATGALFTVTVVVAVPRHPLLLVTVSVYVPAIAAVAELETVGFLVVLVNPFGPVQL